MTMRPVTIGPDTGLQEALDLMAAHGLRHLPVMDADGKFVGIVRDHHVRAAQGGGEGPKEAGRDILSVTELGTPTLHGNESVENAWTVLGRNPGFNPLPVVNDGKLTGTVSQHDLLRAMAGLPRRDELETGKATLLLDEWAARSAPLAASRRSHGATPVATRQASRPSAG